MNIQDIIPEIRRILKTPLTVTPNYPHVERDDTLPHASQAGQCARRIWLHLQEPSNNPQIASMAVGTFMHDLIERELEARFPKQLQTEVPLPTSRILGTADIVADDGVIDLKFVHGSHPACKGGGQPELAHKLQVGIYTEALGKTKCCLVYVNRAYWTCHEYTWTLEDPFMLGVTWRQRVQDEILRLNMIRDSQDPPIKYSAAGPLDGWSSPECQICPHYDGCQMVELEDGLEIARRFIQ